MSVNIARIPTILKLNGFAINQFYTGESVITAIPLSVINQFIILIDKK